MRVRFIYTIHGEMIIPGDDEKEIMRQVKKILEEGDLNKIKEFKQYVEFGVTELLPTNKPFTTKENIMPQHYLPNFRNKVIDALVQDLDEIKKGKTELAEHYTKVLEEDILTGIKERDRIRRDKEISELRSLLGTMSNYKKLEIVKKLMQEISDNWNEAEVAEYGSKTSFDELMMEVCAIDLKPDVK